MHRNESDPQQWGDEIQDDRLANVNAILQAERIGESNAREPSSKRGEVGKGNEISIGELILFLLIVSVFVIPICVAVIGMLFNL